MRSTARKRRKRRCRTASWAVCALLVTSLWRGPVPWIHSHETLKAQGLSEAALAWHVHHLHPEQGEHSIFGWHVHLTYPWEVANEPSPVRDPQSPKPRSVYDMPCIVSSVFSTIDVDPHSGLRLANVSSALQSVLASVQVDAALSSGRHFKPTDPPSVSLRALICVARC